MISESNRPVAVVTGGSRGIGAAITKRLSKDGFDIGLIYRSNTESANKVKEEIISNNKEAKVFLVKADISEESECQRAFEQIKEEYKTIDVLVNNAGKTNDGLTMRMSKEQFEDVINTNLTSAFFLTKLFLSVMSRNRYGRIINMSSIAGVYGNAGQANYAASKAGLIAMSKSISKEMGKRNITANVVAPGFINTDMTQSLPDKIKEEAKKKISLNRFGNPEDVAGVVSFLASEDSSYITGQVIEVSGGLVL